MAEESDSKIKTRYNKPQTRFETEFNLHSSKLDRETFRRTVEGKYQLQRLLDDQVEVVLEDSRL